MHILESKAIPDSSLCVRIDYAHKATVSVFRITGREILYNQYCLHEGRRFDQNVFFRCMQPSISEGHAVRDLARPVAGSGSYCALIDMVM
jgi:hypothetical protein